MFYLSPRKIHGAAVTTWKYITTQNPGVVRMVWKKESNVSGMFIYCEICTVWHLG